MTTILVRATTFAGVAALLALAPPLQAQTPGQPPAEACKPGAFTVIDYPDEFGPKAGASFEVLIDDDFQGGFLTQERIWLPSIVDSIQRWNYIAGSKWLFHDRGLTSEDFSLIDDKVTIAACGGLFPCPNGDPPLPPGGPGGDVVDFFPQATLAVTLITEDNSRGKAIKNSDIFFNPQIPFEVNPNDGQIDFETVLVHELGHALGLGHNDNCVSTPTVMESVVDLNERKRSLSDSEIEGVRFLYPIDEAPSIRIFPEDLGVSIQSRSDGLPPFERPVNIYGLRNHRWTATAADPWVVPVPAAGRFGSDDVLGVQIDPTGLGEGIHRSRITLVDEDHPGPPVTVDVAFEVNAGTVSETELPVLAAGGVVNGANQLSGNVAPGSLITIYGQNLASGEAEAQGFPLPRSLLDTEVVIDGRVAPLLYVSEGQINAVVPQEAYPGRSGIILRNAVGQDRGTPLTLMPAAPELFLMGDQHVIALNQDGSLNGPGAPAAAGSYVTIFFTGLGWTHPFVETGTPAPADSLAVPQLASRVVFAGGDAEVQFIGMTPGFAGLAQANVRIPEGFTGQVPIQIEIGGVLSNMGFLTLP